MVATLGSKEGLANLASAITSPGDTILVPNPSYPIHQFGFIIAGAAVRSIPATPDEDMLRALDRAVRHSVPKPTALIVNFPSNPTAYLADLDFYKEIVAFARRHEIWVMSDLAYAEIYFGDNSRRRRSCRCRAPRTSRWSSPACRRPTRCPAGGWGSRPATSG